MKRHIGGFMTIFVATTAIILLCGTALLGVAALRERDIAKGEAFANEGKYAEAAEFFKKADKLSLRPDGRIVKGLAEAALGLEDYDSATKYYKTLTDIEPDNVEAHFILGRIYIRNKDFGAAEKEISSLRAIGTEDAVSCANELASQMQSGMVKGLFRDLFKKIAPNFPKIPGLTGPEQNDEGL